MGIIMLPLCAVYMLIHHSMSACSWRIHMIFISIFYRPSAGSTDGATGPRGATGARGMWPFLCWVLYCFAQLIPSIHCKSHRTRAAAGRSLRMLLRKSQSYRNQRHLEYRRPQIITFPLETRSSEETESDLILHQCPALAGLIVYDIYIYMYLYCIYS